MLSGGCHCGAVRYQMPEAVSHHTLDCRKASGAPAVAWALAATDQIVITGETRIHESSEYGRRHFCGSCGTGLFYTNDVIFPGQTDVQSATLDDPDALPLQAQIQTAERIGWMETAHDLPSFHRYPGMPED